MAKCRYCSKDIEFIKPDLASGRGWQVLSKATHQPHMRRGGDCEIEGYKPKFKKHDLIFVRGLFGATDGLYKVIGDVNNSLYFIRNERTKESSWKSNHIVDYHATEPTELAMAVFG